MPQVHNASLLLQVQNKPRGEAARDRPVTSQLLSESFSNNQVRRDAAGQFVGHTPSQAEEVGREASEELWGLVVLDDVLEEWGSAKVDRGVFKLSLEVLEEEDGERVEGCTPKNVEGVVAGVTGGNPSTSSFWESVELDD